MERLQQVKDSIEVYCDTIRAGTWPSTGLRELVFSQLQAEDADRSDVEYESLLEAFVDAVACIGEWVQQSIFVNSPEMAGLALSDISFLRDSFQIHPDFVAQKQALQLQESTINNLTLGGWGESVH